VSVFEALAYFVEDVEVVLDVFDGAVVGELIQQLFDVVFGGAHDFSVIKDNTLGKRSFAKNAQNFGRRLPRAKGARSHLLSASS
jgi:hypothetical protein